MFQECYTRLETVFTISVEAYFLRNAIILNHFVVFIIQACYLCYTSN